MFFFPIGFLIFSLFILPIFFLLIFFHLIAFGFEKLGISPTATLLILFLMLIGSLINIPLTKRKMIYVEQLHFFGLIKERKLRVEGIFINFGGAVIPLLLSIYFLTKAPDWEPVLAATVLMILICNFFSRPIPGKGIGIPVLIPPLFAVMFSLILAPNFAAPTAFISGVLGTLIGADLLNLRKIQKLNLGFLSIGGAGVFDGIFLIGIVSALLAGIL